ncbi:hypothetical protein BNJ_00051 [Kaumoebavirus]|uniref:hypothetical protein n=1 Tax=Kaumoebavirus TaxID=1859492 RepID=UPI0009C2957D|nr:hypothetical protein BNJ_00051 [Kaumoebavirus]ARA71894.1 hypothetical protein BNJ_00051 [Kaumoebavirus]
MLSFLQERAQKPSKIQTELFSRDFFRKLTEEMQTYIDTFNISKNLYRDTLWLLYAAQLTPEIRLEAFSIIRAYECTQFFKNNTIIERIHSTVFRADGIYRNYVWRASKII